jgi:hypothetical protein
MEEEELARWRRLGGLAVEDVAQPFDVDELVVVRKAIGSVSSAAQATEPPS